MDAVLASQVRAWSKVEFDERAYPAPTLPDVNDPLQIEVDRAHAYLETVTGRIAADITEPTTLATQYKQAIQMRTEQTSVKSSDDYVGDINEDAINFRAGSYAQDRISDKERRVGILNPWPDLDALLLGLLTDEKREEYIEAGIILVPLAPAEAITYDVWIDNGPGSFGRE